MSNTMNASAVLDEKREALDALCVQYCVRRLDLFGSATGGAFDPITSDLDFLVEFGDPEEQNRADQYFGFLEALETLFGRSVDLVQPSAIRNPYFARKVEETRVLLYAA
jgi:predicted nucleotidyltransferase